MKFRVAVLGLLVGTTARAEPSRWDRIADPSLSRAFHALVRADAERIPKDLSADGLAVLPSFASLLALRSAIVLELGGGAALDNSEVWFYLGDALVMADHDRDAEGRALLERALERAPASPDASNAWRQIGIASDRLGDFKTAANAYTEALRVEWDKTERSDIYTARAESEMALGDLAAARRDYLSAISASSDAESIALAEWGLAVALARDDDLADALRFVAEASRSQFQDLQGNPITALELPYVMYTPAYEFFCYRALAAMAAAKNADDPKNRRFELDWAASQWTKYLAGARQNADRWVPSAEALLAWCRRALEAERPKADRLRRLPAGE